MNRNVTEEVTLLIHVVKWLLLATVAGLLVGLSSTFFLKALREVIDLSSGFSYGLLLLPFGLMASAWITTSLAPEAGGQGVERVIQAVHLRSGKIHAQVIPAKLVATLLTIGFGGSAGNVGPCTQMGGGLASLFSDLCKLDEADRKTLVICGISAGFASVLGTPIAGALFGIEALFVGSVAYQVLLPSVVAATVAHQVALGFGVPFWTVPLDAVPAFSISFFPWILVAGILFGLCAILFVEGVNLGMKVSFRLNVHPALKGFLGGCILLSIAFMSSVNTLGLGDDVIQDTIKGHHVLWYLFLIKILVTSITLNFGGSGGILLPICFVGATAGAVFAQALDLPQDLFAVLGLAGLLAGAVNTPLTAVVLVIELFGLPVGAYAMVVCAISFLISGHRSAIPTQLLRLHKAPRIHGELDQEIGQTLRTIGHGNMPSRSFQSIIKHYFSRTKKTKKESE